jgi:hypothetical protein
MINHGNKDLLQAANILVAAALFLAYKMKSLSKDGGIYLLKAHIHIYYLSFFEAFLIIFREVMLLEKEKMIDFI